MRTARRIRSIGCTGTQDFPHLCWLFSAPGIAPVSRSPAVSGESSQVESNQAVNFTKKRHRRQCYTDITIATNCKYLRVANIVTPSSLQCSAKARRYLNDPSLAGYSICMYVCCNGVLFKPVALVNKRESCYTTLH